MGRGPVKAFGTAAEAVITRPVEVGTIIFIKEIMARRVDQIIQEGKTKGELKQASFAGGKTRFRQREGSDADQDASGESNWPL